MTKYYKAFKRDMTCRDFQYEEGGVYEIDGKPVLCERGFHFVKDLVLALEYYPVTNDITENFYAEVEPLGDVVFEEPTKHKGVTNKLRITRVIPDDEIKKMVDAKYNSGYRNSGNSNSGDWNSGHSNSGNWNSGDSNSGNWNSGNKNSGNWNSGNWNSGNSNSGDWNSGNRNSGDWNSCDFETGAFNTKQKKTIRVFNKKCNRDKWESSYKPNFLFFTIDKELGYKGSFIKSWNEADPSDREKVRDLPNFDADIFYELSGIKVK